jgi:probable rRNA maturation factor
MVRIHNGHSQLRLDRRAIATAIHRLDTHAAELLNLAAAPSALHPLPPGELSVAFLTDATLARLHATFLDDPSPTDVLPLPALLRSARRARSASPPTPPGLSPPDTGMTCLKN